MVTDNGQHIGKRRVGFGVPSSPLDWYFPIGMQRMGQQRYDGVETQQTGRRALYATIGPLPLGLKAQMGAAFLEGRFRICRKFRFWGDF
jgi:hypothetical protein